MIKQYTNTINGILNINKYPKIRKYARKYKLEISLCKNKLIFKIIFRLRQLKLNKYNTKVAR